MDMPGGAESESWKDVLSPTETSGFQKMVDVSTGAYNMIG